MSDVKRFNELLDIQEHAAFVRENHAGHFTEKWVSSDLSVVAADFTSQKVTFRFPVLKEYQNPMGTFHGGAQATIFDVCTSWALAMIAKPGFWSTMGTTRTLVVNCLRPGMVGDYVLLETEIVQAGKRMALLRAEMRREKDGALITPPPSLGLRKVRHYANFAVWKCPCTRSVERVFLRLIGSGDHLDLHSLSPGAVLAGMLWLEDAAGNRARQQSSLLRCGCDVEKQGQ
nr:putative esterase f42h10.6 [Quercus suber]